MTGERLTREQAIAKWRARPSHDPQRRISNEALAELWDAGDEAGFFRGCVKTTQAQARALLECRQEALANSPLPQVVEALTALVSEAEDYHCDMPDDECFSDQEWYSTPLSQEAIVAARAALKAAKGAMNG